LGESLCTGGVACHAGDRIDFQKSGQAGGDADTDEGDGDESLDKGKGGDRRTSMETMFNHGNYKSNRHTVPGCDGRCCSTDKILDTRMLCSVW
jgi:hypothetical protein